MPPNSNPAKKKVLWVEDDGLIGTILAEKIIAAGFDLVLVKNGEDALSTLAQNAPDAIVLDLLLPGISGFEVLEKISADPKWKKIPVMILSNLSKPSDWERVRALGAKKFLVKPDTSLDKVVAEIKELCDTSWI